ncbi:hypothetical protein BG006_010670 [Podila minutissima]|uniref:Uncharacterized protein n=1 Tax=Podila minutissima TaxID=64525 RepID=A0A9P5SQW5_9FUNG|nr:hypothetical protein BG006_010670 [Podila minutissima]
MKEKDLLTSFLLGNELHDSVTLQQFTKMFPPAFRTQPEVKDLYRVYLNSRHQIKTTIKRNIDIEVRRNPFHLAVDQASRQGASFSSRKREDDLEDIDIEDVDKHLTLDQAIQELSVAEKIYKEEIQKLENDCASFAQEFQDLDKQMESTHVPQSLDEFSDEALMTDLQELIRLCGSITDTVTSE